MQLERTLYLSIPSWAPPLSQHWRHHKGNMGTFRGAQSWMLKHCFLSCLAYFPFSKYQTKTDLNIQHSSISHPFVLPSSLQFLPTSFSFWIPILESLKTFFGLSPKTVIFFSTEGNFTAGSPDNIGRPFWSLQLEEDNTGFSWVEIKTTAKYSKLHSPQ